MTPTPPDDSLNGGPAGWNVFPTEELYAHEFPLFYVLKDFKLDSVPFGAFSPQWL